MKIIITVVVIAASLGIIYILTNNKNENEAKTAIVAEKCDGISTN
jgi:CDP-diacylglycerol pyrophosphatase